MFHMELVKQTLFAFSSLYESGTRDASDVKVEVLQILCIVPNARSLSPLSPRRPVPSPLHAHSFGWWISLTAVT